MIQKISKIVGWLALTFIAYTTLSPIGARPVLAELQLEHFAAFGLVGVALGLAYPKRLLWVTVIVVGSAFGLKHCNCLRRIVTAACWMPRSKRQAASAESGSVTWRGSSCGPKLAVPVSSDNSEVDGGFGRD